MVLIEGEKQLQGENCTSRLQTLELEGASLREECMRPRSQVGRLRAEKQASEEPRGEEQATLAAPREESQTLRDTEQRTKDERMANARAVEELNSEIDQLKAERKGEDIMEANSQSELNGQLLILQEDFMIRRSRRPAYNASSPLTDSLLFSSTPKM